jgi:hypothetical protein
MDEKSTDIIKPQDIEVSHLENPYEKPTENFTKETKVLPNDSPIRNKEKDHDINENNEHFDNNDNYNTRIRLNPNIKPFMPIPKRIVILSLVLFMIGSAFLISGLVDYFQGDRERGIAFIVFGSLMFIPGMYYTYQIYLACMAGSPEERQEILEDIPQIDY